MAKQEFDLSGHDSNPGSHQGLHSSSCPFSHYVWFPTKRLPFGTDPGTSHCPDPGAAGFSQGWTPLGHQTVPTVLVMRAGSEEGHFLHPPKSQPGFLDARTVVTCEPPLGLNCNRLVAWPHGALKEKSHAGAGWMHMRMLTLSWRRRVLFQLGDDRCEWCQGRSLGYQVLICPKDLRSFSPLEDLGQHSQGLK